MALIDASVLRVYGSLRQQVLWASALCVALLALNLRAASLQTQDQKQRGFDQTASSTGAVHNGDYYALVIGIDEYPAPMHPLKTAVNDARAVGQLLQDRYGFKVEYLLNGDATRYKILSALGRYRASLHADDNLLIYYGGHGYFDHETDKAYWLPADADSGTSPNTIMADDLTSLLRALPSRHVLVVSDSCYSGGLSRDADEPARTGGNAALLQRELDSRSRTLMASGGLEPVTDAGGNGHSVFASAFLHGLQQDDDPSFTAIDLFFSSIRRQVAGRSSQLPEYSTLRNSGDDDGDFVFVRKADFASPARAPAGPIPANASVVPQPTLHETAKPNLAGASVAPQQTPLELFNRADAFARASNIADALPLYTSACKGGNGPACTQLALMYFVGNGVEKDSKRGTELMRQACSANEPHACSNLGVLIDSSKSGGAASQDEAVKVEREGCNGGVSEACSALGKHYDIGKGVGEDDAQAVSLYRKACDGGYALGCSSLGNMYWAGKGVAADAPQALILYRKGCDGGDALGCSNLAYCFERGMSVKKDKNQAISLYRKACDGGDDDGCKSLKRLQP